MMRFIMIAFGALIACVLMLLGGCSLLGIGEKPFQWLAPGNQFVYDYYSVEDTLFVYGKPFTFVEDARTIEILESEVGELLLRVTETSTVGYMPGLPLYGLGVSGLERREDGIYGFAFVACDIGLLPIPGSDFLRVPASPSPGDRISTYHCAGDVESTFMVREVGKTVETAIGSFETFVMNSGATREYWSEEHGLIRVELLDDFGRIEYYFELSSRDVQQE